MNKKFLLLILILLCFLPFFSASAASFPAKLKGAIILQAQGRGQLWYVHPITQEKYYFNDATGLFKIVKTVGLGISNKNFDSLSKMLSKFAGRILIKVEDKGQAYYIAPGSLKIIYLGRPNEIFKILAGLSIGVANKTIDQIKINKNFPETARVIGKNETSPPVPEPQTNEQTSNQTNTSTSTETQIATTTPPETPLTQTATSSQSCQFLAEFYDNRGLFDPPATTTYVSQINYNWGKGGPEGLSIINRFSARWTSVCYFAAGTYRFTAIFDDAMDVYIDSDNIIRSWTDNDRTRTFTTDRSMTEGWHDIKVQYYEAYNNALAQFSWEKIY